MLVIDGILVLSAVLLLGGSYLYGRLSRDPDPLRTVVGVLEIIVGALGLLVSAGALITSRRADSRFVRYVMGSRFAREDLSYPDKQRKLLWYVTGYGVWGAAVLIAGFLWLAHLEHIATWLFLLGMLIQLACRRAGDKIGNQNLPGS